MIFFIILIALFIDKVIWDFSPYREYPIFSRYSDLFHRQFKIKNPYVLVATMLLPFILIVVAIQIILFPIFGSIIESIISCILLIFCLGPSELGRDINNYISAHDSNDKQSIENIAHKFSDVIYSENYDKAVIDGIFWNICQRLIAPIFWFLIVGIAGAVIYRFIQIIFKEEERFDENTTTYNLLAKIFFIFNWMPVRITLSGYAAIGNFDSVMDSWKNHDQKNIKTDLPDENLLLINAGYASLSTTEENRDTTPLNDAKALIWRNLTLWIIFVGIMSLFLAL